MSKIKDNYLRSFDVPETARHPSGHTTYKIVLQVTPKELSEDPYQLVYWKRYSDIRQLYNILHQYHHAILRPGELPDFPDKSGYLERFQPGIVEQRRVATKEFLNFALKQIYLRTHAAYVAFFQDGEKVCLPDVPTDPIQPDVLHTSSPPTTPTIAAPLRSLSVEPLLKFDEEDSCEVISTSHGRIHDDLYDLQIVEGNEEKSVQSRVENGSSADLIPIPQ